MILIATKRKRKVTNSIRGHYTNGEYETRVGRRKISSVPFHGIKLRGIRVITRRNQLRNCFPLETERIALQRALRSFRVSSLVRRFYRGFIAVSSTTIGLNRR